MGFYYNNVASDATSGGGSVKDPVANFAALPMVGNTDGDLRATLDTHQLYIWNQIGGTWEPVGAGAVNSFQTISTPAGSSPVANSSTSTLSLSSSDSSIVITGNSTVDSVDFALASTISGARTFSDTVSLNGQENTGLSGSVVLVDNTAVATNAFSYPKSYDMAVFEFSIARDSSRRIGLLFIVTDGTDVQIVGQGAEVPMLTGTGVTLSALISGSNVVVQYTTTNTGFNASLKYVMRRWAA